MIARSWRFKSSYPHHDGVTKKMSRHFFLYSCGFAGFFEQNSENGFTVDVQRDIRRKRGKARLSPDDFRSETSLFCVFSPFFPLSGR